MKSRNPRNQFYTWTPGGVIPPGIVPQKPIPTPKKSRRAFVDQRGFLLRLSRRDRLTYWLHLQVCSVLGTWHRVHPADRELIALMAFVLTGYLAGLFLYMAFKTTYQP